MKYLITLILLLSLKLLPGQVPTDGLSLQDVVTEIGLPANSSLQDCFDNANAGGFDPAYDSPGDNRLSEFRKYLHNGVRDISGNGYPTVEIGTRRWMAKNLRTRKYNDSTNIPFPLTTWTTTTSGGLFIRVMTLNLLILTECYITSGLLRIQEAYVLRAGMCQQSRIGEICKVHLE